MVALAPRISGSLPPAGITCLCAPRGSWSTLKAHTRSFSFAILAAGDRPSRVTVTTPSTGPPAGARPPSTTPVVAIVGGAVGGIVALAVVLALVYVLRVRRRVEQFRRSMNVLGPELAPIPIPIPIPRPPPHVASIDVAVSRVAPSARHGVWLADGTRLASPSSAPGPSLTSPSTSIESPKGPPSPTHKLTIDVYISRAIQHTSRPSAGPQIPTRSPC